MDYFAASEVFQRNVFFTQLKLRVQVHVPPLFQTTICIWEWDFVISPLWKFRQTPRLCKANTFAFMLFILVSTLCLYMIWMQMRHLCLCVQVNHFLKQHSPCSSRQINGFSWVSHWRKATKDVKDVRFRKAVGGKCIIQLEPGLFNLWSVCSHCWLLKVSYGRVCIWMCWQNISNDE